MDILITAVAEIARERLLKYIEEVILYATDDAALWGFFTFLHEQAQGHTMNSSCSSSSAYQNDRNTALANIRLKEIEKQLKEAEKQEIEKQQEQRRNSRKF